MGKGGKPKVEVNEYYMAIHMGACVGPADAFLELIIGEKTAWAGEVTEEEIITVDKRKLFGGPKKEGGVAGLVHYLPGGPEQTLSDFLAAKLGRSSGADCPGFRGLTSLFFTGTGTGSSSGSSSELLGGILSKLGGSGRSFYWTANSPYLKTTWGKFRRAPKGLDSSFALIPRSEVAAGRWWRIFVTENNGDAGLTNLGEIQFRATIGGADLVDTYYQFERCFSGGAGSDGSGGGPAEAFNNNAANGWDRLAAGNCYIGFKFPSSLAIQQVVIQARTSGAFTPERCPKSGTVDYSDDDGETWTTAFSFSDQTDWAQGEIRTFEIESEPGSGPAYDANPAHMIYECLTNRQWGMGAPVSMIDVAAFQLAGYVLYGEGLGLSMIWTHQTTIEAFVTEILDHIQATVFVNPRTGLLTIKLIRDDYDPETLREITVDNADLTNFQRKAWGEIANEVTATWTNPLNEQEETVTAQDLASIAIQGIIPTSRNYYGVRKGPLAMRLAHRDLRVAAAPLASCDVVLDRSAWDLLPGEVVKVIWPEHGLDGVIMRVGPVDYGRPGDPTVKAALLEDVFSLSVAEYTDPPSSGWDGGGQQPDAMDHSRVITLPAMFARAISADLGVEAAYPEVLAGILASTDNEDAIDYDLLGPTVQLDGTTVQEVQATNTILGRATLTADIAAEALTAEMGYEDFIGNVQPAQNVFLVIGGDADPEAELEIALISVDGDDFVVHRGLLDTVPRAWPAGTPVWFLTIESSISDFDIRSEGESVAYKLLMRTSLDVLDEASAPTLNGTLSDRPWLPNRPANVTIGGVQFNSLEDPVDMSDRADPWVTASWAVRNRLIEDSTVMLWSDGTAMPEDGQTTTITVYAADGVTVIDTITGLTGTSHDIPDASFGTADVVLITFGSSRADDAGTFDSLTAHGIWVRVKDVTFDETDLSWDSGSTTWDDL